MPWLQRHCFALKANVSCSWTNGPYRNHLLSKLGWLDGNAPTQIPSQGMMLDFYITTTINKRAACLPLRGKDSIPASTRYILQPKLFCSCIKLWWAYPKSHRDFDLRRVALYLFELYAQFVVSLVWEFTSHTRFLVALTESSEPAIGSGGYLISLRGHYYSVDSSLKILLKLFSLLHGQSYSCFIHTIIHLHQNLVWLVINTRTDTDSPMGGIMSFFGIVMNHTGGIGGNCNRRSYRDRIRDGASLLQSRRCKTNP